MYQPDLSIPNQPLAAQRQQTQDAQQKQAFDLNTALSTEKLVQEHYNSLDAREKNRIRNVSIAAAQVKPFLDAGDAEGALQFAQQRQRQLHSRMGAGENIDDEDTQAFIDYLQKGDLNTAKGMVDSTLSIGYMTGALKPQASDKSAMGQVINQLMAEDPNLTYAGALYKYQTGNRQGTQLDANGNVVPMTGAIDVKKDIKKAEASGKLEGELTTQAQYDLPKVIDTAENQISLVNKTLNAKGIEKNFGLQGIIPNVPGGAAADAQALLTQIKSGAFLSAFESLKGGGQITELEGKTATDAIVRAQNAQSFESFKDAMEDYQFIINKAVKRAKNAASGQQFNSQTTQTTVNEGALVEARRRGLIK